MLKFIHLDNQKELLWFYWPFVYFHGQAENINIASFNEGGQPPDLCMASEPLHMHIPCGEDGLPKPEWKGTASIPCEINGKPAVCVLSKDRIGGMFGGRIAFVDDFEALQHVMQPQDWR